MFHKRTERLPITLTGVPSFLTSSSPLPWANFLRDYEEIRQSREEVDILKDKIVKFTCVIFQVQDDGTYPLELDDPRDAIDFCIVPLL